MKVRIVIVGLIVCLGVSIVVNINQASRVSLLELFLDESENRADDLDENLEEMRDENSEALFEVSKLKNELNNFKSSQRRKSISFEKSEGVMYRTIQSLEVHSTFSESSAILGEIPKGEIVEVIKSSFSKFWKIKYRGISGWVITDSRNEVEIAMDDAMGVLEGGTENRKSTRTLERVK